jgi:hypothetical protein
MDLRGLLQDARAEMLMAQAALDDYVMNHPSNPATFQSLFDTAQTAHTRYATMLREYMHRNYPNLQEQSASLDLLNPAE